MAKKKKNEDVFKPEESIKVKRQRMKETYIMEAVTLGLLSMYLMLNFSAYQAEFPRADMAEVFSSLPGVLSENPFYFATMQGYSIFPALGITSLIVLFVYMSYAYGKLRIHSNLDTLKGRSYWESAKKLTQKYAETIEVKGLFPWSKKQDAEHAQNNAIMSKGFYVDLNTKRHFHALNTLVLGVSGSGKTRFWLKPNLLQMNSSFAITDPKGEILESCGEILRRNGYDVKVFDVTFKPGMPIHCNTYNPLVYCEQESDIRKIVNSFVKNTAPPGNSGGSKDPFWEDSMMMLLCAIIGFLCSKPEGEDLPYAMIPEVTGRGAYKACFPNVCELVRMSSKKWTPQCGIKMAEGVQMPDAKVAPAAASELGVMFENLRAYEAKKHGYDSPAELREKPYCLREWENIYGTPDKTFETIKTTTTSRLDPFNIEQIKNLTATDNINLFEFPTKKTALFLVMSATDRTYNFLLSFLYTQLFDVLYRFGETEIDGSKSLKLKDGELVRWFSKKDVSQGNVEEEIKKIKNAHIEKEVINGEVSGKYKGNPVHFDDSVFNIVTDDGELISRRPTKALAERYLKDLQNVELKNGRTPALPIHFRFLIDEFPNIGEIPEFKEKLATMRGYEISATVICQSITQLKGMYEKDYEVIDANCPFLIFLGGDENSNNEYLFKKLGNTTASGSSNSIDKQKVSVSVQRDQQALMNQEDIGRIPYSNMMVFTYGEQPLYDEKPDVVDHKNYKLSREYFQEAKMDAMYFDRSNFIIDGDIQIFFEGCEAVAIPNVIIGDSSAFMKAIKSHLKASTKGDIEAKANANIERFMFENESVAVAY